MDISIDFVYSSHNYKISHLTRLLYPRVGSFVIIFVTAEKCGA